MDKGVYHSIFLNKNTNLEINCSGPRKWWNKLWGFFSYSMLSYNGTLEENEKTYRVVTNAERNRLYVGVGSSVDTTCNWMIEVWRIFFLFFLLLCTFKMFFPKQALIYNEITQWKILASSTKLFSLLLRQISKYNNFCWATLVMYFEQHPFRSNTSTKGRHWWLILGSWEWDFETENTLWCCLNHSTGLSIYIIPWQTEIQWGNTLFCSSSI